MKVILKTNKTHENSEAAQLFFELAKIYSPSGYERQTADFCSRYLSNLGACVYEDQTGFTTGGNAGNVIATFEGTDKSLPPLMLNAHMDTVEPGGSVIPEIVDQKIVSRSDTILGADNRAGLVMILMGLKSLFMEHPTSLPLIEVVLTVGEESGLIGASHLDYSRIKSKFGFSFDSSGLGRIVVGAPFYDAIKLTVFGRSAHAGVNAIEGLNSIVTMSHIIQNLHFGKINDYTTANIGTISGGTSRNVVPDRCSADIEVRSHSLETLNEWVDSLKKEALITSQKHCVNFNNQIVSSKFDIQACREFNGFVLPEDAPVVLIAELALKAVHRNVIISKNMGGSDANMFNSNNIQTVIIGTGQTAVHSHDEFITLKDLGDGVEVVKNLIIAWTKWWSQKIT
jgi:tripeptide aminopeptidase